MQQKPLEGFQIIYALESTPDELLSLHYRKIAIFYCFFVFFSKIVQQFKIVHYQITCAWFPLSIFLYIWLVESLTIS